MKAPWSLSIRAGLVLLTLLAVLPALALQLYDGVALRRHLVDDATQEARRATAAMAQTQTRITDSTRLLLSALAAMPEVCHRNSQACSALFASLLNENPVYINILAVDAKGDIFASGLPYGRINLSDRKHFKDAMGTDSFATGEYVVSRTAFHPAFPLAMPFRDDTGNIAGVLVASIKLSFYDATFDKLLLPKGAVLGITDYAGIRLYYRPKAATNPLGSPINPDVWKAVSEGGEEGVVCLPGSDGHLRYYAYQKLRLAPSDPPYMTFMVGLPESAVLAPSRTALLRNLSLLATAGLLAVCVAWFVGGPVIAARLDRIAVTADRIGQGDLSARTGLAHGDGGIGKVAKTIDAMAALLSEHDAARELALAALRHSQERMAHITASMADCVWEIDEDDRYVYVSPKVREILGLEPQFFIGKPLYDFLAPGQDAVVRQALDAAKAARAPLRDLENWRAAKDGSLRCMQTSGVPWHDENGRFQGYRGVDKDVTERFQAERRILDSLKEKEILLKEIHHRVKNNLQIISGLLYLQEEHVTHPTALEAFRESRSRIASMALVHEELYRSTNLASIGFDNYIQELLPRLFGQGAGMPDVRVDCDLKPVGMAIEQAVPAGLILNEILTNAYKHAFKGRTNGVLSIRLNDDPATGEIRLEIRDNGPGWPEGFVPEHTATLGMQLVVNLTRQLRGAYTIANDGGAVFSLRFFK